MLPLPLPLMRNSLILIPIILLILVASALYLNDMISSAKRISVNVERMEIAGASFEKVTINVTLCMENPSSYYYSAEEMRYGMYVEDAKVGNGSLNKIAIPPKSRVCESSLMDLYYSGLGKALTNLLSEGKIDLNVNGTMKVNVIFIPVEVKFSERKTIKL
jgi:LEA14-like dessication related protein